MTKFSRFLTPLWLVCAFPAARAFAQARRITPATTAASAGSSGAGAWSLPDPSLLIEQVLSRIVAEDKPGAVAMNRYARRFVGRAETIDAVRRFTGRSVDLAPSAFTAVTDWTDARALDPPKCDTIGCPPTGNSVWLAVTRIERGEVAREVFVWYTTNFIAFSEIGAQKQKYAFCERWVRAGGRWSYEGFIRVSSGGGGDND